MQFYVHRNSSYSTAETVVPNWQFTRMNFGGAMNLTSGVFSAPKDGIYHFHFSGITYVNSYFVVQLRLNFVAVGSAHADGRKSGDVSTGSLHSTLQLKKNDQVDLWLLGGLLYDDDFYLFTHFNGWMDDEDLRI